MDSMNKSIPNSMITVSNSVPLVSGFQYNKTSVNDSQNGSFSIQF